MWLFLNTIDFLKEDNQYQLNGLTKFLFNKYGFEAYMEHEKSPPDLLSKRCSALYANVEDDSSFLVTRLKVTLSDCDGNPLYISDVGKSKEKEYEKAYHTALRNAFLSIEELKYSYKPSQEEDTVEEVQPAVTPVVSKKEPVPEITVPVKKEPEVAVIEENEEQNDAPVPDDKVVFKSTNSGYSIHRGRNGYTVFDGDQKIGTAKETSSRRLYLIQTSDFDGVGRSEGDAFIVERSIKGVDGLVKMTFRRQ